LLELDAILTPHHHCKLTGRRLVCTESSVYNQSNFRLSGDAMNIQTVLYLKANASNLSLDTPLHVTQNGKEVYVVQDASAYQEQQETIALLKLINLSERSLNRKGEISLDNAFDV